MVGREHAPCAEKVLENFYRDVLVHEDCVRCMTASEVMGLAIGNELELLYNHAALQRALGTGS